MKRYQTYRNIRKRALIYGLPVPMFALMILVLVGSLFLIIFSYSLPLLLTIFSGNIGFYFFLLSIFKNRKIQLRSSFPPLITNSPRSFHQYED